MARLLEVLGALAAAALIASPACAGRERVPHAGTPALIIPVPASGWNASHDEHAGGYADLTAPEALSAEAAAAQFARSQGAVVSGSGTPVTIGGHSGRAFNLGLVVDGVHAPLATRFITAPVSARSKRRSGWKTC